MANNMFKDLEADDSGGIRIDFSTLLGGGVLAGAGSAFIWTVANAERVQKMFENPVFLVMGMFLVLSMGVAVSYIFHGRPKAIENKALKASLKAAITHAQACDVELAEVKKEFETVARFIDGYQPSFMTPQD